MTTATFNGQYQIDWDFTVVSQSVTNNTSTIYGRLIVRKLGGAGFWAAAAPAFSISGFGAAISGNWGPYDFRSTNAYTLWQGTRTFAHAANGTLNLTTSASVDMYNSGGGTVNGSVTKNASAPTIPRVSSPTIGGGANLTTGTAMTMTMNRQSTAFSHIIRFYFGDYAGQVGTTSTNTWTWTPPDSLFEQFPNSAQARGFFTVLTMNGSTEVGRRNVNVILTGGSAVYPRISAATLSDSNSAVTTALGAGNHLQGMSGLRASVTAEGAFGSTIVTREFGIGGDLIPVGETFGLDATGTSIPVNIIATDSRARTDEPDSQRTINVYAYDPPRGTLLARRSTAAGALSETGTSIRADITSVVKAINVGGTERNDSTLRIYTRTAGTSTWTLRHTISPTAMGAYNTNVVIPGVTFPVTQAFDVRLSVADKFASQEAIDTVATATILMDWNGETGVGIGKYHTQGVLDVGGAAHVDGELYVKGLRTAGYLFNTNVNTPFQDYPPGASVGETTGGGWPTGTGIVLTVRYNDSRTYQEVANRVSGDRWWRGVDANGTGGAWGWTPWIRTAWRDTGWVSVGTLSNSFGEADSSPPEYRLKGGICYLRGGVTRTTAPTGQGAFTLPSGARPTTPVRQTTRGATTEIIVDTNGVVSVVSPTALGGSGYTLGGISYPID